nr:LemA family protein [Desulfobacula sp.]
MQSPLLKLLAPCSIAAAIVLFCIVFGGYTSFYRSQNRIEASKTALAESCRERRLLLPELSDFIERVNPDTPAPMDPSLEKADTILRDILLQEGPLKEETTRQFESSQTDLTLRIKEILARFENVADPKSMEGFEPLKQKIYKSQDALYVAVDRYNYEVCYFNGRIKSFPVSLIAKLFGFHKIIYHPFPARPFCRRGRPLSHESGESGI